ncbi:MAG: hypothetical protein ACLRFL_02480 [Clostridia bacterium]
MSTILSFEGPLEFLLRYTVITGMIIAIIGVAICLIAKRVTMAIRNQDTIDKKDNIYVAMMLIGLILILVAMIVIALPIEGTFYTGV